GRAQIVSFDWPVATTVSNNVALLALISANNDSLDTSELNVATLAQNNKKCGLKNVTVVNPSPGVGPVVRALPLELQPMNGGYTSEWEGDHGAADIVRGVVLSKRFSKLAKKEKLKEVKLTADDKEELSRLVTSQPLLQKKLDMKAAYRMPPGRWFGGLSFDKND